MADPVEPTPAELQAAKRWLESVGLGSLYEAWDKYVRAGYTDMDQIMQMISTDAVYQERFNARFPAVAIIRKENEERVKQGLPLKYEPTAQDYVNLEVEYRNQLRKLGPVGEAMANKNNFTKWIVGEVNGDEIGQRLAIAEEYLYSDMNKEVRRQLRDIYGLSDAEMIQYVTSDTKTQNELITQFQQNMRRANVNAAAAQFGLGVSAPLLAEIAGSPGSQASSFEGAKMQFANVAEQADAWRKLGEISGDRITTDELAADAFSTSGAVDAAAKKKRLASQERARFSKSSGLSRGSLSSGGLGSQ